VTLLDWFRFYGEGYLAGMGWTAFIGLWAGAGALLWGCLLLLARLNGGWPAAVAVDAYTQLARNTPVLLPIYLFYFGLPMIGWLWPAAICGGLALIVQNGAYVSEILRGSYKAVDSGQSDGAKSLGLSPFLTFRKITLPQVVAHALPALGNQFVLLVKDTSLLSAIAVPELTMNAKYFAERTNSSYEIFIVTAVLYLAVVATIEFALHVGRRAMKWHNPG
jgi:His/Glu/Gln/Arg/opine family amino acid ABC transporter permease subunit